MTNTLLGVDYAQYPGASCMVGTSNLISLQPQNGAVGNGSLNFTLSLGAAQPVGIVHLQNLVNVTSVTVDVGAYSATRMAPPNATYGQDEWQALGRALFFVLP